MRLNKAEILEYKKLQGEGWTIHRNGWPDFLAEKDGIFRFVEVKRKPDRLSGAQKKMCAALFRLTGIKLEVRYYSHLNKKLTSQEKIEKKRAAIRAWARGEGSKDSIPK